MTGLIAERVFVWVMLWMYVVGVGVLCFRSRASNWVLRGRDSCFGVCPGIYTGWMGVANVVSLSLSQDEPRLYVESEDEPGRVLLETRIIRDDGYQKQQGPVPSRPNFYCLQDNVTDAYAIAQRP